MKNVFILCSFLLITFNVSANTFKTEIVHNDENVIGFVSKELNLVEAIDMYDFTEMAVFDKSYVDEQDNCTAYTNSCGTVSGWICYNTVEVLLLAVDLGELLCE